MRDAVLDKLGFGDYVRTSWDLPATDHQKIVQDMAPEPFFGRLVEAGVDLSSWLRDVLHPTHAQPNAAHDALAELCAAGAKVWTVNFDPFIEEAALASDLELDVIAWPRDPQRHTVVGELLKPHGSLGGKFIITPADVLRPLSDAWLARLRADLAGSTHVVFVGYSGRDVDFQNVWREVIDDGQQILWFDRPGSDRDHKLRVLKSLPSVEFPASKAHRDRDGKTTYNPSWDFVEWCRTNRLVTSVDGARQASLLGERNSSTFPDLPQSGPIVQARFAQTLGAVQRAQRLLWTAVRTRATRTTALTLLIRSWLNTSSPTARAVTSAWWAIPSVGRAAACRKRLRHYRLVQLFNAGHHRRVVRLTDGLTRRNQLPDALLGLRWGSQKMLGNVAGVIEEAGTTAREGRSTNSALRCVAAFHWCHSLVWAGRFSELRWAFESYFKPIAMITDSRWMAWADYIESCLMLADSGERDVAQALERLDSAITRFAAEGHRTGLVDVRTVQLTALRLVGDIGRYTAAASFLQYEDRTDPLKPFGRQALILELAQALAYKCDGVDLARRIVEPLCHSIFPVHAAVAYVLCGQWETDEAGSTEYLTSAQRIASDQGFRSIATFCDLLSSQPLAARRGTELVFP
ncbi:hypothetical protein BVC93_01795 [Mycobacterium sp. MS1601]|nr:hypothetical protein BVC93_01795 [Mycobacterium sp. MS1601]